MPNIRKGTEFPTKSGIIVTAKTNPSGSKAYRVDIPATITGRTREQRQFPTKDEANRYAGKRHAEITKFGHSAFSLSADQRNDATRAIAILASHGLTLEAAAKIAVKHIPRLYGKTSVRQLRELFLEAPGKRKSKLTQRRPYTLHNLAWRTARFEKEFGSHQVTSIQAEQIKVWMASLGKLSPVSLNNYRRTLHAMFAFGVREGHCSINVVADIALYHVPDKSPAILSVEQASRLVSTALETEHSLGLLGYVSLALFAGLRRSEIERLDWSAVKRERRMVTVDGSIAKTGSIRNVSLTLNAIEWLNRCGTSLGRVTPRNLRHRLCRLRFLAGITQWEGNELRHSFASYHFDLHQNGPLTAAQLGHSSGCQLLFEHYRSLVPLGDGQRFFDISCKVPEAGLHQA